MGFIPMFIPYVEDQKCNGYYICEKVSETITKCHCEAIPLTDDQKIILAFMGILIAVFVTIVVYKLTKKGV
jgi:hypothetical protein